MRVCPLSKIYLEQSTITEFISHLSSPAPDPQSITPPGVLPTQAPQPCCCSRSSKPNGEGSPTARPSADKRKREKMWRSIALTSPQHRHLASAWSTARTTPSTSSGRAHSGHADGVAATVMGDLNRRMLTMLLK